jgi:hypothetical protein
VTKGILSRPSSIALRVRYRDGDNEGTDSVTDASEKEKRYLAIAAKLEHGPRVVGVTVAAYSDS